MGVRGGEGGQGVSEVVERDDDVNVTVLVAFVVSGAEGMTVVGGEDETAEQTEADTGAATGACAGTDQRVAVDHASDNP